MFFSRYPGDPWKCNPCIHTAQVSHEKTTDLNIAVEMIMDVYAGAFHVALVITADSDLVPAIAAVKETYQKTGGRSVSSQILR
jgi:hypothetical protein